MQRILAVALTTLIGTSAFADINKNSNPFINSKNLSPLQRSKLLEHPPKPTSTIQVKLNLNAADFTISSPFDQTDPETFDYTVSLIIYDSLGAIHTISFYFAKAAVNTWKIHSLVDFNYIGTGALEFSSLGTLSSTTGMSNLSFAPESGATSPQIIKADFSESTQYAGSSTLNSFAQDGYPYEPDFHSKTMLK